MGEGLLEDLYILMLWAHRERRFISQQKKEIFYKGGGEEVLQTCIYQLYEHIYKGDLWVSKQKEINEQINKGDLLVNKQKEINENGGGEVLADPDILVFEHIYKGGL